MNKRLEKFLLLLGSDKPGEIVAAAGALCRTLKADGHDLHDLVGMLNGKTNERIVYRDKVIYPKVEELSAREVAQLCIDKALATRELNDREWNFIRDMADRYSEPTEKQRAWLYAIHDKLIRRRKK